MVVWNSAMAWRLVAPLMCGFSFCVPVCLADATEGQGWTQEDLHKELVDLKAADKIRLLLVPVGADYVTAITPRTIESSSCIYRATSSSSIAALVEEISSSVVATEGRGLANEVRAGILFYKGKELVASLYFVNLDFINVKRVSGIFNDRRVDADLTLGNHLRNWTQRPDVTFIEGSCGGPPRTVPK